MWLILALSSSLFLGVYDIFKKLSVNKNAVIPVLLGSTGANLVLISILFFLSKGGVLQIDSIFYIPAIQWQHHLLLIFKAILVLSSWICVFFAMKHLPITMVAPIRSTSPIITLLGGVLIFSEKLSHYQWLGVVITILFFFSYSTMSKSEDVKVGFSKWNTLLLIGTFLGGVSGLYDKYLCNTLGLNKNGVQFYYTMYQFLLLIPLVFLVWFPIRKNNPFEWRWAIPFIGLFLFVADFLYFFALSYDDASISIVSLLRRGSVVVVFAISYFVFKEQGYRKKIPYIIGLLVGMALLMIK